MATIKKHLITYIYESWYEELDVLRKVYERKNGIGAGSKMGGMSRYMALLIERHLEDNRELLDEYHRGIAEMVGGGEGASK